MPCKSKHEQHGFDFSIENKSSIVGPRLGKGADIFEKKASVMQPDIGWEKRAKAEP